MTVVSPLALPVAKPAVPPDAAPPAPAKPFASLLDTPAESQPDASLPPPANRDANGFRPGPQTRFGSQLLGGGWTAENAAAALSVAGRFDAVSATAKPRDALFGFDELGMFGLYAAQSAPGTPVQMPSESPSAALDPAAKLASPPVVGSGTSGAASPLSLPLQALEEPPLTIAADEASIALSSSIAPSSDAATLIALSNTQDAALPGVALPLEQAGASAQPQDIAAPLGSAGSPGKALPHAAPAKASLANLLVTGPDGALSVIIRSADTSAEDFATLRRLAEDAAQEFGMRLGDLRLNGGAPQPSFGTLIGDRHGRRPG